uniref:Dicer n=1 Tax=Creolimax fragrantissima TaxID=470921 RepID=A0A383QU43_CREFR|nr:Dicer [Creolimax fragrantissima]|eukprot:CFRG3921T1
MVRFCNTCYVLQRYGKRYGSNKSCNFETVPDECGEVNRLNESITQKMIVPSVTQRIPSPEVPTRVELDRYLDLSRLKLEQTNLPDFQKAFPLFEPVDPANLEEALTHPSASAPFAGRNYLRLAFIGDSMLGMYVTELLYAKYPDMNNGDLTVEKSKIVSNYTLGVLAKEYLPFLKTKHVISKESKVPGDLIEALIGAYFLACGYDRTKVLCKELGIGQ